MPPIAHQTLTKEGEGFTAILGLSDDWMRRYPDMAYIKLGLCSLQIFCFEADAHRPPPPSKRAAEIPAGGAPAPKSARRKAAAKPDRPRDVDPASGKAARAAEAGSKRDRRPSRNTRNAGLIQRSKQSLAAAKDRLRRQEVAGVPAQQTVENAPYPLPPQRPINPNAHDWLPPGHRTS